MALGDIIIGMRLAWNTIYANFNPLKIRKIAQLQENRIFTCNPIKNENTHHELPVDICNAKQDRKIWVIKICCFPGIIIMQHFCKMTSFAKQNFYLKITAKSVFFPRPANILGSENVLLI